MLLMETKGGEGEKKAGKVPRPACDVVVVLLCSFNFTNFFRQLYRLCRQLLWRKVVDVNAAQTAMLCTGKNGGLILTD